MNVDFPHAAAVALLAESWRSGEQLRELPADGRPATLEQGYAIQDRLVEALDQVPFASSGPASIEARCCDGGLSFTTTVR